MVAAISRRARFGFAIRGRFYSSRSSIQRTFDGCICITYGTQRAEIWNDSRLHLVSLRASYSTTRYPLQPFGQCCRLVPLYERIGRSSLCGFNRRAYKNGTFPVIQQNTGRTKQTGQTFKTYERRPGSKRMETRRGGHRNTLNALLDGPIPGSWETTEIVVKPRRSAVCPCRQIGAYVAFQSCRMRNGYGERLPISAKIGIFRL